MFRTLPKVRRLPECYQEKVQKLMDLQVNKKLLQEDLVKETGKQVTLKDLSNLASKTKKTSSNFDEILHLLQNVYCCSVSALKDDDSTLQGIFFQDSDMKLTYSSYPEVLFFDGTYKLLNNNFTCYIYLIEDGNGFSEIVGVGLLSREDKDSMEWLIGAFKQNNKKWTETRVIVTDKDLTERAVFTHSFPNAQLEICLFHTFKTFRREITPEKMGISKEVCNTAKEYLTKLAYSRSEESYSSVYKEFVEVAPPSVIKYFNDNWHDLRKEWTYMSCMNGNFLNMTNNRLESINGKLKAVIKKFSSFPDFIKSLFSALTSMRRERDNAATAALLKNPSYKFPAGSAEECYQAALNPYTFGLLLKQISMSRDPKTTVCSDQGSFTYEEQGRNYPVSLVSCTCLWNKSMKLPCRHILSVRQKLSMPMFEKSLCDTRWLRCYLTTVHRIFNERRIDPTYNEVEKVSNQVPKTPFGRYSKLMPTLQKIGNVASESVDEEFLEKERILQQLLSSWEKGSRVSVCAVEPEDMVNAVIVDHNYGQSAGDNIQTAPSSPVAQIDLPLGGEDDSIPCSSGIKLPAPVKRKGRPSGLTTTVVGLKRRKCCRPVPFTKKALPERQRLILKCFVEEGIAKNAVEKGILIEESDVECDTRKVSSPCMEPCVSIDEVQGFFTPDGWLMLQNVITTKSRMMTWECHSCQKDCSNANTVLCDSCLMWFHYTCVGLLQRPKQKYWFCRNCSL